MAVNLAPAEELLPIQGVRVGSAAAEIKYGGRLDLAIFEFVEGTQVGGVFTQSHFAAAPVVLARARQLDARAWLINSGNANAATGDLGEQDAAETCAETARYLQMEAAQVQPFSTGVIGERLPVERMRAGIANVTNPYLKRVGWTPPRRS